MEHKHTFTDTPDGTLAGTWRSSDRLVYPVCSWIYDLPAGLLRVTRGRIMREYDCPIGIGMSTDEERRRTLPLRALEFGRNMRQPH